MKKKNPKDNKGKKVPQLPNAFVPQNLLTFVREEKLITCGEEKINSIKNYTPEIEPFEIPPEWVEKSEEEMNNELIPIEYKQQQEREKEKERQKQEEQNKVNMKKLLLSPKKKEGKFKDKKEKDKDNKDNKENKEKETIEAGEEVFQQQPEEEQEEQEIIIPAYNDPKHEELINNLPLSFLRMTDNNFEWLRPEEYIVNGNIDRDIKKLYPNKKKPTQMRDDIKKVYKEEKELIKQRGYEVNNNSSQEENVDDFMNDDTQTLKKTIYKDFFKYLDTKPNITIVKCSERDETEEEYQKRVIETIEKQKENLAKFKLSKGKNEKKPVVQKPEEIGRIKIFDNEPSNIDIKSFVEKEKLCVTNKQKNELKENYAFLCWISSVYQFILDLQINDCVTHKTIFSNIYPQINGSPIYNPNGHYLVKLYFMGKPRIIEIDDRMPCTCDGEYIFPRCDNLNELWPALFTKALLKLNIYKVKHPFYARHEENVDTSYIYSLTGYHAEILHNLSSEEQIQNLLNSSLSDDNVLNKKKYILCLNLSNENEQKVEEKYYEDIIEVYRQKREKLGLINSITIKKEEVDENKTKEGKGGNSGALGGKKGDKICDARGQSKKGTIYKSIKPENTPGFKMVLAKENLAETFAKGKEFKLRHLKKLKTFSLKGSDIIDRKLEVIVNFAYSINDFFFNYGFNMDRLKVLDFEDMKRKLKATNVVFKQLTQAEKKDYIAKRRKLKAEQLEIKNERIEQLKNDGSPFLIIKIKNDSVGHYKIHSKLIYNEEEINMGKKCILNNWKYPPPIFFEKYFQKYDALLEEENKTNNEVKKDDKKKVDKKVEKISVFDWTRDDYIELIGGDLSKYESTEENQIKCPISKISGGHWMTFKDFSSLFNTFLILHNPNSLFTGGKISVDNNWLDYKVDCYEPLDDFVVLALNNEEIQNKEKMYSCFIIFEPNNEKTLEGKNKINNYIVLDIVDENNNKIYENITMNKFYSTHFVENLNGNSNYYIIIKGGIYKFGFFLQLYSEGHKIENMSYQNYLSKALGYQFASFKVEHPLIDCEPFYLITKLHIVPASNEEGTPMNQGPLGDFSVLFNIKYPVKHLKPFIKIFIQKEEKDNVNGKEVFINEEIHLKEGNYIVAIYFHNLTSSVKENICDIDVVFSNKNYTVEQIDNIDYYQISDEYVPNRHNIIFKETIYSCDIVYSSLCIKVTDIDKKNNNNNSNNNNNNTENNNIIISASSKSLNPNATKKNNNNNDNSINNKTKLIFLLYQLTDKENTQVNLIENKFAHGLRGILLKRFESYSTLIIPNITFEGGIIIQDNKKGKNAPPVPETPHYPYLLICYVDNNGDFAKITHKIEWEIKVFPSDHLCFIGDKSKEDNEKFLKNAWEENEPGRAEKAKISRRRFMIERIRKQGGELTEDDKLLLNSQRIRKTFLKKDENGENTNTLGNKDKKKIPTKIQITAKKNEDKDKDKEGKKEENKESYQLNTNKNLPYPQNHRSTFIRNYLKYAYIKRIKEISNIEDQYKKQINDEKIQMEKEKLITETMEDFNRTTKTEMNSTFYFSEQPKDEMFSTFYKMDISTRTAETDALRDLIQSRNDLKMKFKEKINAQNTVIDVLKNYIVNSYDIPYMLQCYKETVTILGKDYEDEEKLFKLISNKKEEEIKNLLKKLTPKDKPNIIKLIEEVELNQLMISPEVMSKLKELIK